MPSRMGAAVVAALLALPPPTAAADWIEGVVGHVRDGDTIVVGRWSLRLMGLHAPERHEAGGAAARRWMIAHALGQAVVCRRDGGRSHDRLVAVCFNGGGDLAAQLVAAGLGRDCPRFSRRRYAALETDAGRRLPLPAHCHPRSSAAVRDGRAGHGTGRPRPHPVTGERHADLTAEIGARHARWPEATLAAPLR